MKCNLFAELTEGVDALRAEREGKVTLRKHQVERKAPPCVSAEELLALRTRLHLSRPVFARYLRTNERTPGKLGAGPCQTQCPGRNPDPSGRTLSGYHGAAGFDLTRPGACYIYSATP